MAINYPARALGITKGMYADDAYKLCKDVRINIVSNKQVLPHVDTFKIVDG